MLPHSFTGLAIIMSNEVELGARAVAVYTLVFALNMGETASAPLATSP